MSVDGVMALAAQVHKEEGMSAALEVLGDRYEIPEAHARRFVEASVEHFADTDEDQLFLLSMCAPTPDPIIVEEAPPESPDELLGRLEEIGWFREFDNLKESKAAIEKHWSAEDHPGGVVSDLFSDFIFDAETIYDSGPEEELSYSALVKEFGERSHGHFSPTEINDVWKESGELTLSFKLGDKQYSETFEQDSDWYQDDCHQLINRAMEEQGSPYRFCGMPTPDQCARFMLQKPEVWEAAIQQGVIDQHGV